MKLYSALFLLMSLLTLSCTDKPQKNQADLPEGRKNIVVILADDHALKVTGTYGNDIINTPNIDRLATEGMKFTNAYCNSPICSASRQSLLTGKYPHATGVNLLFTPFPDEGNTTIAEHLRDEGYATALVGKTHFNNWMWGSLYKDGMPDHGFDHMIEKRQYNNYLKNNPQPDLPEGLDTYEKQKPVDIAEWMNARILPHPHYDEFSQGTFLAKEAVKFVKEQKEQPFFLWLAFNEPHHPYYFPIEYAGKYKPEDMPLPGGSEEDDRWVPARYKHLTDDEKRGIIASYYTSVEYLDKNIGMVMDAISEKGMDDNTIVIYISDNGYLLNDHKRFEKHTMWEEATQQPMIVKLPGVENGTVSDALVEYVDVVPTLLDLSGNAALEEAQGRSFASVLKGEASQIRDYIFTEYLQDNLAMVANDEWKYVFHTGSRDLGIGYATGHGPSGIVHRLYNLKEDPSESHSLAGDPQHAERLAQMQQLMLRRFMDTHPDAANCPAGLTTEGKLVWFCEPRDVGADQDIEDAPVRVYQNQ